MGNANTERRKRLKINKRRAMISNLGSGVATPEEQKTLASYISNLQSRNDHLVQMIENDTLESLGISASQLTDMQLAAIQAEYGS